MDLWVVKYARRRFRMRNVRALPWSEAPGSGYFKGLRGRGLVSADVERAYKDLDRRGFVER
jgi:hypothetical protein